MDRELLDTLGNGVDKLQFVIGMLTSMELVAWAEVEPFLKLFDELDKDGSGTLDQADLAILEKGSVPSCQGCGRGASRAPPDLRQSNGEAQAPAAERVCTRRLNIRRLNALGGSRTARALACAPGHRSRVSPVMVAPPVESSSVTPAAVTPAATGMAG